jgi:hypothetical protein
MPGPPRRPSDGQEEDAQARDPEDKGDEQARPGPKREGLGGLDAAATVLTGSPEPMGCKQLVAEMLKRKLWSTKGKTPAATIGAALGRDIQQKKDRSRFRKVGPGRFALRRSGK